MMRQIFREIFCVAVSFAIGASAISCGSAKANDAEKKIERTHESETPIANAEIEQQSDNRIYVPQRGGFDVQILVNGYPVQEYAAFGRRYIEAAPNAEYSIQIHNPLPVRVAVALSVDGLNTIDARRTTAWNASKWVLEPDETITISGWQMSSSRARRFYFTTERDSYAARIGRASDLGVISAVFYREQAPRAVITPRAPNDDVSRIESENRDATKSAPQNSAESNAQARKSAPSVSGVAAAPAPTDEYAATGIGRNVRNDVTWVSLALDPHPVAQINMRYEYHDALVRLGVIPRTYPSEDALRRREHARGFENGTYCPKPK